VPTAVVGFDQLPGHLRILSREWSGPVTRVVGPQDADLRDVAIRASKQLVRVLERRGAPRRERVEAPILVEQHTLGTLEDSRCISLQKAREVGRIDDLDLLTEEVVFACAEADEGGVLKDLEFLLYRGRDRHVMDEVASLAEFTLPRVLKLRPHHDVVFQVPDAKSVLGIIQEVPHGLADPHTAGAVTAFSCALMGGPRHLSDAIYGDLKRIGDESVSLDRHSTKRIGHVDLPEMLLFCLHEDRIDHHEAAEMRLATGDERARPKLTERVVSPVVQHNGVGSLCSTVVPNDYVCLVFSGQKVTDAALPLIAKPKARHEKYLSHDFP
jgi:hypothetical protein